MSRSGGASQTGERVRDAHTGGAAPRRLRNRSGRRAYRFPRFSYHLRFAVAVPMHAMSMRPSPLKSAAVQPAAAMPPSSSVDRDHVAPVARVDPNAVRPTALADDDLVDAVAIEIGGDERVAVDDRGVDHLSREYSPMSRGDTPRARCHATARSQR